MTAPTPSDASPRRSFQEIQRDHALAEVRRTSSRNHRVGDIVSHGNAKTRIGTIVVVEDGDGDTGAYVVEATLVSMGTVWYVVNEGQCMTTGWYTMPMAMLHLLSVRYGDDGDRGGSGAVYAARALRIPTGD